MKPGMAEATGTVAGNIGGRIVGRLRERRRQKKLMDTQAGRMVLAEEREAAKKQVSGDYGMSEAEKRKTAGQVAEAGKEDINQLQRQILTEVARSGGRSGKTSGSLVGLAKAKADLQAKAGGQAAAASQQQVAAEKAQGAALAQRGFGRQSEFSALQQLAADKGAKEGAKLGKGIARGMLVGTGTTSAGAGD